MSFDVGFSVVIPMYNTAEEQLKSLCEALSKQDCSIAAEYIFVDNGSENYSALCGIVTSYGFYCITEHVLPGSYAARNKALSVVQGRYIIFTDDDCTPAPSWLSAYQRAFALHGDCLLTGGISIDFDARSIGQCYDAMIAFDQEENVSRGCGVTANLAVPMELFEKFGQFNSALFSGGDVQFTRGLTSQGVSIFLVHDALVSHPARSAAEVLKKMKRMTAGHYKARQEEGIAFSITDYLKPLAKPIKVLLSKRKIGTLPKIKAALFALIVGFYRVKIMVSYQIKLETEFPRS